MAFYKAQKAIKTAFKNPAVGSSYVLIIGFNPTAKTKDGREVQAYKIQRIVGVTDFGRPLYAKAEWVSVGSVREVTY